MRISIIYLLTTIFSIQLGWAQYHFSGTITNSKKEKLDGVQVVLTVGDSLTAMTLTNDKGYYLIENLESGEYMMHISDLGYSSIDEKLFVRSQDVKINFVLLMEMIGTLGEVEVKANRNDQVERTATGQIFHLSEQAKNSGNAYRALKEIPKLIVNEAQQSITMENGNRPLILINGNKVNSGVNPIDPKEIESVEVVDVVNARYLQQGVRKIVNIKLKKKTDPYRFFEVMNRHDAPIRRGMGALYFEVGNPTYSLYGRTAGEYIYNDDSDTRSWQQNEGYRKEMEGLKRNNKYNGLGELQFRWMGTDKDYLVAHVYGMSDLVKDKTWGDGLLRTDRDQPFGYNTYNKDKSYILTGSLFHKHLFTPNSTLETTFAYNKNKNENSGDREEMYSDRLYNNYYEYKNNRSSYKLNVDYSYTWNEVNSLNIGNETNFRNDRILQVSENYPPFIHKEWTEYLYAAFSSKVNKFSYMASAGIEGFWLKADNASNHYFKPRAALSGTYEFNDNHSLQLGYTLTNTTPSVHTLNPYNTSTDSLVISKGNPYLLPTQNHQLEASYTFNKKGFYLTPYFSYAINTDLIESYGYTENGIYISSYRNSNHFKQLLIGGSISYRSNWGRIYGGAYHQVDYYSGQDPKKSFIANIGFMAWYKKFSFNVDCNYTDYVYSAVSRTRQYAPNYSLLQLTYNFTKLFYISIALENSMGMVRSETTINDAGYRSYSYQRMKDQSFCPWILIRYTFRKNSARKIKENKVLKSTEKGISL